MSLVSFVRINGHRFRPMKQAISESLRLIDFSFPKGIRNVVIKPNLCYYWDYSTGETTDPRFVAALIELLRERTRRDLDIKIVESDASAMKCRHVFKMLGYERLSQECGAELVNLSEDRNTVVRIDVGGHLFRLRVPEAIGTADLKVNIPKIKYTIEKIRITCALKNIFGCNPYPRKFRYHSRLGEVIVAVNKAMKFDLCLVDGSIVPGVQPRRFDLVMASKDPVSVDAAAGRIVGINPRTIEYLKLASKEGLGKMDFVGAGEPLEYFRDRYPRKNAKNILMGKAYSLAVRTGLIKRLGLD